MNFTWPIALWLKTTNWLRGLMPVCSRRHYFVPLCLMGIWLGGCATTKDLQLLQERTTGPIRILAVQSPATIEQGRLKKLLAEDSEEVSNDAMTQTVKHAEDYASASMQSSLGKQSQIKVVVPSAGEEQLVDEIRGSDMNAPLSQDEARRLQETSGADALLRYKITDYGLTPKAWRKGYITFEVTTTLAIAAVIAYAGSNVAKAAAGAYLVQETVEETAEAYAGFWGLDVAGRPVRIEAQLVLLDPLATVWQDSETGLSDIKLSRLTRNVDPTERNTQLDQATDDAVGDLVAGLAKIPGIRKH
jgi:hypothetical protein